LNQAEIEIKHLKDKITITSEENNEDSRRLMGRNNIISPINVENKMEWKEAILRERKEWIEKPIEEKIQIDNNTTFEAIRRYNIDHWTFMKLGRLVKYKSSITQDGVFGNSEAEYYGKK
jgi:hypothetical protein